MAGLGVAATDGKVEVSPRGRDVTSPFFGVARPSLRKGVASDLVMTPMERGSSTTASSSERPRRSSLYDGGDISATSSTVASDSSSPFSSKSLLKDTDTGEMASLCGTSPSSLKTGMAAAKSAPSGRLYSGR